MSANVALHLSKEFHGESYKLTVEVADWRDMDSMLSVVIEHIQEAKKALKNSKEEP